MSVDDGRLYKVLYIISFFLVLRTTVPGYDRLALDKKRELKIVLLVLGSFLLSQNGYFNQKEVSRGEEQRSLLDKTRVRNGPISPLKSTCWTCVTERTVSIRSTLRRFPTSLRGFESDHSFRVDPSPRPQRLRPKQGIVSPESLKSRFDRNC